MEVPLLPDKSLQPDGTIDVDLFVDEFEAYFDAQVIGDIQTAIVSDMGAVAYILISCAIDCLASFWCGRDSNKNTYESFVNKFFNGLYEGSALYRDLRCRLVHNYSMGKRVIICWDEPDIHRSHTDQGELILNLDQFFEEFDQAKMAYFLQVRSDPALQERLVQRWEDVGILSPIHPDSLRCHLADPAGTSNVRDTGMTPDEIKRFIQANFPGIAIDDRNNPDGWSFWYSEVRHGPRSTRIARALDDRHGGTRFKLSVTSRLSDKNVVCSITSEEQLRELFEEELRLGLENFGWSEQN